MRIYKINAAITRIDFDTQQILCRHFIRFQEYYESPKFRKKPFTLGEFREWHYKEYGAYTYEDKWSGFNVPGEVLNVFRMGLFDPLTTEEQNILNKIPYTTYPIYLIGTYGNKQDSTLDHEICHGLYYTDPDYKSEVDKLLASQNLKALKKYLESKQGYCEEVLQDECHAYIATSEDILKDDKIEYPNIGEKLRNIKNKYFKEKIFKLVYDSENFGY